MKLAKVLVTFGAIVSLVACGKGDSSVSQEKFTAEAEKAAQQSCDYNWATLTYKEVMTMSGTELVNEELTAEFYLSSNGEWVPVTTGLPEDMPEVVGISAYVVVSTMGELPEGYTVKYYVNPLKIVTKVSQTQTSQGQTITIKGSKSMEFESHGLLTTYVTDLSMSSGQASMSEYLSMSVAYSVQAVA